MGLFKNVFGANAYSNRELKRIEPIKNKVLELDEEYQELYEYETEQERKGLRRLGFFFCLLQLLMSALLMYQVWTTGFLPLKFFIVGCAALFLLFVLIVILVYMVMASQLKEETASRAGIVLFVKVP